MRRSPRAPARAPSGPAGRRAQTRSRCRRGARRTRATAGPRSRGRARRRSATGGSRRGWRARRRHRRRRPAQNVRLRPRLRHHRGGGDHAGPRASGRPSHAKGTIASRPARREDAVEATVRPVEQEAIPEGLRGHGLGHAEVPVRHRDAPAGGRCRHRSTASRSPSDAREDPPRDPGRDGPRSPRRRQAAARRGRARASALRRAAGGALRPPSLRARRGPTWATRPASTGRPRASRPLRRPPPHAAASPTSVPPGDSEARRAVSRQGDMDPRRSTIGRAKRVCAPSTAMRVQRRVFALLPPGRPKAQHGTPRALPDRMRSSPPALLACGRWPS